MEGDFECSICAEVYNDAKVLPCQHKFCESCLTKLTDKSGCVTCPVCRASHHFGASGGVSRVSAKSFLKEWLDYFTKHDKRQLQKCEGCQEGECVKHCIDCGFDMCKRCAVSHSRFPNSRLHVLVTFKELYESHSPTTVQPPLWCYGHPANQVEYFCDTCNAVICIKCTILDHPRPQHSYRYLKDAAIEFSNDLKEMVHQLNIKAIEINDSQELVRETLEILQRCHRGEEKKLNSHIQKLTHEISCSLQHRCHALSIELRDEVNKQKMNLTARLKELECIERELANARECVEKLMYHGNSGQVMIAKNGITTHIEAVLKTQTNVEKLGVDFFQFKPGESGDISSIGKIHCVTKTQSSDSTTKIKLSDSEVSDDSKLTSTKDAISPDTDTPIDIENGESGVASNIQADNIRGAELNQKSDCIWMFTTHGWMTKDKQFLVPEKIMANSPISIKPIPPNTMIHRFGQRGDGADELCNPWGLITTRDSNILMCDYGNCRLQSFTTHGQHIRAITFPDIPTSVKPVFLAQGSDGTVFITDHVGCQVVVLNETGKLVRCFGEGTLKCPFGIAVSKTNGHVYVADHSRHCIHIFNQKGDPISSFGSEGNGKDQLQNPVGVAVDKDGRVLVADSNNHRIQVYNADGKYLYSFGCHGTRNGQVNCPSGVDVDIYGNAYVCDRYNNRVLKYDSNGSFICRLGSNSNATNRPVSVCVTDHKPFHEVIVVNNEDCLVQVFAQ